MEYMHKLKEKLCDELEEIARKGELGAGDLEIIHKLTDTIKNLDKIEMLEEGEYSQARDWDMGNRTVYDNGNSYANRGKHYVRGHYSRERRDSRGRYSREGAKDQMMEQMEEMMDSATTDREREIIRRAMDQLEKA